ncbi:PREDICTED: uncharacterized protein LOC105361067 [Ceratosolen solmsi marchali]|uniref:Uncharacterized protein LOC105361067 n=1 Tax=Ceratosolen solmsi marchali TaxID=326594 RepID=A0AAJ6YE88_9HYME|nr:PREDICTED: uncharacterized protein LOC105361067 [Ceratosolen solmsi marchali]XP_011496460.1 PREDICTED: uncharacterized protein LOC105361067 [Ceratosolen solmsi marchali]XP_011496461.1 PREDICTED: uncharacterized protein LOC105361067 [Ceratosolen solmsi marchali]XP_011496462.1 PREDICTED: uncharacterized protein LOC105361067 [Ceratosolen solmsi marchali]XP_011496463.1 PREDICTED: uncharacterized protein LOC105361067 [Ceratosolen solmsi marchali]XP_011496464.1 PREDICTED: uncharacterized protein 
MPGHRQPNSLEGLSLGRVCQLLDGTCRRLQVLSQESSASQVLAYAKQTIRPYYANSLTARLRSQVIEETSRMLYGPSTDGSNLISGPAPLYLLALLLGHDIKKLKVNLCCYYGCSHQTSLLKLLATEGIGLESLELARSALLRLDCKLLRSALVNMKNLQRLTLRNIASDAVLQVVGKSCPKLVILDVACSRQVTDAGLKQLLLHVEFRDRVPHQANQEATSWSRLKSLLTKLKVRGPKSEKRDKQVLLDHCESRNLLCDSLKVLNVANTGVTSAGVLLALMNVPQLESLAEYSHMGRVVEIMNRGVIDFKTPFSLTQARSCRTTPARLELLAQACPRVEKLHIAEPHHPPEALRLFPYVTSLSVYGIPVQKEWLEGFYGYLKTNGHTLKELDMRIAQSEVPLDIDLKEIFFSCANLRSFVKDGSNVIWSTGPDPPTLKYLKRVQVGRMVSALAITKILSLAPCLTALHVHSCFDLTNEQLERLLSEPARANKSCASTLKRSEVVTQSNSLVRNLECFYIYEASKVSASTVLNMFKSCGKLKRIGNLANWGLDCEGVRTLRNTLAMANLDVDLCPGSHWFWNDCIQ